MKAKEYKEEYMDATDLSNEDYVLLKEAWDVAHRAGLLCALKRVCAFPDCGQCGKPQDCQEK